MNGPQLPATGTPSTTIIVIGAVALSAGIALVFGAMCKRRDVGFKPGPRFYGDDGE